MAGVGDGASVKNGFVDFAVAGQRRWGRSNEECFRDRDKILRLRSLPEIRATGWTAFYPVLVYI